jgi:hypothetical protein
VFGNGNCSDFADTTAMIGNCNFMTPFSPWGTGPDVAVINTYVIGSNICTYSCYTTHLNRYGITSNTIEIDSTCSVVAIGPLEVNNYNGSGVSFYDIDVVGSYYSGNRRCSFLFKKFTQGVAMTNVDIANFCYTGIPTIFASCLLSCYASDTTNFNAGVAGVCITLTGSGEYFGTPETGVYLHLKNRNSPAAGTRTVFTYSIKRIEA